MEQTISSLFEQAQKKVKAHVEMIAQCEQKLWQQKWLKLCSQYRLTREYPPYNYALVGTRQDIENKLSLIYGTDEIEVMLRGNALLIVLIKSEIQNPFLKKEFAYDVKETLKWELPVTVTAQLFINSQNINLYVTGS